MNTTESENKVRQDETVLRVSIGESWKAHEFSAYFDALNAVYKFYALSQRSWVHGRDDRYSGDIASDFNVATSNLDGLIAELDLGVGFEGISEKILNRDFQDGERERVNLEDDKSLLEGGELARVNLTRWLEFSIALKGWSELSNEILWQRIEAMNDRASSRGDEDREDEDDEDDLHDDAEEPFWPAHSLMVPRLLEQMTTEFDLRIKRLKFASPGVTDLAGIAQCLKHVKDLILEIIKWCGNIEVKRAQAQLVAEKVKAAELKNFATQIKLLKSLGYSNSQIRALSAAAEDSVSVLANLVRLKKITHASMLDK